MLKKFLILSIIVLSSLVQAQSTKVITLECCGILNYDEEGSSDLNYTHWYKLNGKYGLYSDSYNKEGYYGVITKVTGFVAAPKYDEVKINSSTAIMVRIGNKWGLVNNHSTYLVSPKYDEMQPFAGGFAGVKDGDKWGYINIEGKEVVSPKYDKVTPFQFYYMYEESPYWAVVGNIVDLDPIKDHILLLLFPNTKTKTLWGLIGPTGEEIAPAIYDEIDLDLDRMIDIRNTKYCRAKKGGQVVYINTETKEVLSQARMLKIQAFDLARQAEIEYLNEHPEAARSDD